MRGSTIYTGSIGVACPLLVYMPLSTLRAKVNVMCARVDTRSEWWLLLELPPLIQRLYEDHSVGSQKLLCILL